MDEALKTFAAGGLKDALQTVGVECVLEMADGGSVPLVAVAVPVPAPVVAEYGGGEVVVTAALRVPLAAVPHTPAVFDKVLLGGRRFSVVRVRDVPLSGSVVVDLTSQL